MFAGKGDHDGNGSIGGAKKSEPPKKTVEMKPAGRKPAAKKPGYKTR